jgi:hypothetical protein
MVGAHAAAAVCLALAWPAIPGFLAAALVLLLGAVAGWRLGLLRARASPAVLVLGGEGAFSVVLRDGRRIDSGPGVRFVTRRWVVLRTGSTACRTVLVAAGMLDPAALRRLRVWALWGRVPGRAPASSPA